MPDVDHIGVTFDMLRAFFALHLHDPDADLPGAVEAAEQQVLAHVRVLQGRAETAEAKLQGMAEALNDTGLSDAVARHAARMYVGGLADVTAEDVEWARAEIRKVSHD